MTGDRGAGRALRVLAGWVRAERLRRAGRVDVAGPARTFEATPLVGKSTHQAYADAEAWLVEHRGS